MYINEAMVPYFNSILQKKINRIDLDCDWHLKSNYFSDAVLIQFIGNIWHRIFKIKNQLASSWKNATFLGWITESFMWKRYLIFLTSFAVHGVSAARVIYNQETGIHLESTQKRKLIHLLDWLVKALIIKNVFILFTSSLL